MTLGSTAAFMLTGLANKIIHLDALKTMLGIKCFFMYIGLAMAFSSLTGMLVNTLGITPENHETAFAVLIPEYHNAPEKFSAAESL